MSTAKQSVFPPVQLPGKLRDSGTSVLPEQLCGSTTSSQHAMCTVGPLSVRAAWLATSVHGLWIHTWCLRRASRHAQQVAAYRQPSMAQIMTSRKWRWFRRPMHVPRNRQWWSCRSRPSHAVSMTSAWHPMCQHRRRGSKGNTPKCVPHHVHDALVAHTARSIPPLSAQPSSSSHCCTSMVHGSNPVDDSRGSLQH